MDVQEVSGGNPDNYDGLDCLSMLVGFEFFGKLIKYTEQCNECNIPCGNCATSNKAEAEVGKRFNGCQL